MMSPPVPFTHSHAWTHGVKPLKACLEAIQITVGAEMVSKTSLEESGQEAHY